MTVGECSLCLILGMVDKLPTSLLLGRDVPDFVNMLEEPPLGNYLTTADVDDSIGDNSAKNNVRDNKLSQKRGENFEGP